MRISLFYPSILVILFFFCNFAVCYAFNTTLLSTLFQVLGNDWLFI